MEAARVTLVYATPTVPFGNTDAVLTVGPAMTVMDMVWVAVPLRLSVTLTVKLEVPRAAAVGAPLSTPPAPNESPAGKDPPVTAQV